MNVTVRITKSFKIALKPLLKKFPSLKVDLQKLESELQEQPKLGTPLGHNAYKIRLKISSKGKGKSGGARVISLVETVLIGKVQIVEEAITVNLLTIFDKGEIPNISDKELKDLIKAFHQEE